MALKKGKFLYGLFFAAGVLLSGCNYVIEKTPLGPIPPPSAYKPTELNYATVQFKILRNSCVSCHGTSGNINLESYSEIKKHLTKIYQTVVVQKTMPKGPVPRLTPLQIGLMNAWILAGAPETGTNPDLPEMPPLVPEFESIKFHILQPKCLSCHAPGQEVAKVPLVTKDDLLNSPRDIVLPGNPEESQIILSITHQNPRKIMPPQIDKHGKPTGFAKLSEQEIQVIFEWIKNGAP